MDQHANCGTILSKMCNFTNHEKSGKISAPVKCQARFNLNLKKIFLYSCNLDVFCDKGMTMPQIKFGCFLWTLNSRFGLFLAFFSIVWIFIEIFIWQPW